jgi:hypothetical protein
MILVKVELLKQGIEKSKIKFYDEYGRDNIIIVPNGAIVCKDGEYFITCSEEPIEGAKSISVSITDVINEEENER